MTSFQYWFLDLQHLIVDLQHLIVDLQHWFLKAMFQFPNFVIVDFLGNFDYRCSCHMELCIQWFHSQLYYWCSIEVGIVGLLSLNQSLHYYSHFGCSCCSYWDSALEASTFHYQKWNLQLFHSRQFFLWLVQLCLMAVGFQVLGIRCFWEICYHQVVDFVPCWSLHLCFPQSIFVNKNF